MLDLDTDPGKKQFPLSQKDNKQNHQLGMIDIGHKIEFLQEVSGFQMVFE